MRDVTEPAGDQLLVGPQSLDDAGVVLLGESEGFPAGTNVALVQTVDFFPPVVDDPYLYGAIAAANSLSDVYAMGGKPFTALSLAGFPKNFPEDWRAEIMRGGFEKVKESGAILAGGHTVESEVQYGYSVTGLVDPSKVATNGGAKAGDIAYLTKPLGMGCLTTSAKFQRISWEELKPAALQMATLNNLAAEALRAVDSKSCTDVTGFGLVGHGMNIARASDLTFRIRLADVPFFPGAMELAEKGLFSGGTKRGKASLGDDVAIAADANEAKVGLVFDAETSGGLLILVPANRAADLERELKARDLPVRALGEFLPRGEKHVELV